jgi:hypothetical protein
MRRQDSGATELWPAIGNDVFSRAAQAELDPATAGTVFEHSFDPLLELIPHIPQVVTLKSFGGSHL